MAKKTKNKGGAPKGTPRAAHSGRKKGTPNKISQDARVVFAGILTDETENKLWERFLNVEDNRVAWEAFKRAVEYKRGKPTETIEHLGGDKPIRVLIEHIGCKI